MTSSVYDGHVNVGHLRDFLHQLDGAADVKATVQGLVIEQSRGLFHITLTIDWLAISTDKFGGAEHVYQNALVSLGEFK